MACECCKPKPSNVVHVMNYPETSGIELAMTRDGDLRVRYYSDDEPYVAQEVLQMNFCPNCGRNLKAGGSTKTDCLLYGKERNTCRGLNDLYCAGGKACAFYKNGTEQPKKRRY